MAVQHKIVNASLNGETLNIEAEYESKNFSIGVNQVYEGEATGDVTIEFDEPLVNNETSIEILSTHNVQTGYNQPYVRFDQGRLIVTQTPVQTDEDDDTFETVVRLHFTDNSYVDIWVGGTVNVYKTSIDFLRLDPSQIELGTFGPVNGYGVFNIENIPENSQDFVLKTTLKYDWGDGSYTTIYLEFPDLKTGDFLWDEEESNWYYDGEYRSGTAKLIISRANPI